MLSNVFRRRRASAPAPPCRMLSAKPVPEGDAEAFKARLAALGPWFHNFEIARDVWTNPDGAGPGPDYPARRWKLVEPFFQEVAGKTCLDVGCSSGFFSLKALEMGARSVFGVDSGEQAIAIAQARFAAEVLGLPAEFDSISAYDLARLDRRFDMVFFMGVFYHLRHPLVALEAIRSVCTGSMIFQTIVTPPKDRVRELDRSRTENIRLDSPDLLHPEFPTLRFVEGDLAGDGSCWFIPNVEAVAAMLRSCGFIPEQFVFCSEPEVIVRCRVRP